MSRHGGMLKFGDAPRPSALTSCLQRPISCGGLPARSFGFALIEAHQAAYRHFVGRASTAMSASGFINPSAVPRKGHYWPSALIRPSRKPTAGARCSICWRSRSAANWTCRSIWRLSCGRCCELFRCLQFGRHPQSSQVTVFHSAVSSRGTSSPGFPPSGPCGDFASREAMCYKFVVHGRREN